MSGKHSLLLIARVCQRVCQSFARFCQALPLGNLTTWANSGEQTNVIHTFARHSPGRWAHLFCCLPWYDHELYSRKENEEHGGAGHVLGEVGVRLPLVLEFGAQGSKAQGHRLKIPVRIAATGSKGEEKRH